MSLSNHLFKSFITVQFSLMKKLVENSRMAS